MNEREPPVREGDVVKAVCEGIGGKGDGVFRIKGYVIMCPGTELNKEYTLRITRTMPRVGFAELAEE